MNRARFGVAATLVAVAVGAGATFAQQAPQLTPVLAGKKFAAPLKGQADIEFTKANVEPRNKETNLVVATFFVKNMSERPIARLTVDDTWYDEKGEVVTGGRGVIAGLLNPGEVKEMRIETTFNPRMKTNNWAFSHANGSVIPKQVDMMDGLPEGAKIGGKPAPKPKPTT
jgi:hypothetical protein